MRQRGGGGITAKRDMCLASGKGGLQQAEERWNSYGKEQHNHRGGSGVRRSEQHRKGWHQHFDSNTLFHQKVGEEERAAKRKCDGHRFGATGGHEGHTRTRVGRSGGDFVWERRQDDSGGVHSGGHQRRRGTSRAGAQDILPGQHRRRALSHHHHRRPHLAACRGAAQETAMLGTGSSGTGSSRRGQCAKVSPATPQLCQAKLNQHCLAGCPALPGCPAWLPLPSTSTNQLLACLLAC